MKDFWDSNLKGGLIKESDLLDYSLHSEGEMREFSD